MVVVPELPEVEALAAFLRERAVGHFVARIDVAAIHVLKTYDPAPTSLAGQQVTGAGRHGKFLDLDCDGLHLVVHLARAGWLHWREQLAPAPPKPGKGPIALRLHLDDGAGFDLTEAGTKKGLSVYIVTDPATVPGVARLGIDPLREDFTSEALAALTRSARQQLKGLLTDQTVIAGIGNAYSDEILHVARMSPFKPSAGITGDDLQVLYAAVRTTLADAVARSDGVAASDLKREKKTNLRVHARTGQPCRVCGDTVAEVSFADSSLQYCPTCQTGGKPLADRRMSRLLK